jgi:L-ribulose-5-phosphate 3-epimerase UlaE
MVSGVFAQDKSYNTDILKAQKRITADEWKSMQDKSAARQQQFKDAATGENNAWAEKGYSVLKANQTLNLNTEVNALFESMTAAGQNNTGAAATRKRTVFKIGPGNFEIKEGVIKRVK